MGKCFIFSCFRFRKSSSDSASYPTTGEDGASIVRYSFKTLSTSAQGFQSSCKIGEGGFGSVYKGKLANGEIVAIKVLSEKSVQGEREFLSEIESMKRGRHENLVRLRGYCVEGIKRVLVYDYMEKRSLAQTLLGGRHYDINFTWAVRRKISLGIARGLAYLHEEVEPHIIHRDIKPSNILLDSNLTPKISDFGLAKIFPDNMTHISTRVAGTIGYLAPEYARCGKLTRKSDVYSYGVLLLKIISGRDATNYALGLEANNMVVKAWDLYRNDRFVQLVDPSISQECNAEEAEKFLKVALLCVQEMPNLRPPMSTVVWMLSNTIDTRNFQISQPGVITDLKILKVGQTPVTERTPPRHPSDESRSSSQSTLKGSSGSSSQLTDRSFNHL